MAVTTATRSNVAHRVDKINIGLLVVSFVAAIILPFELFLFSYAVLGPLHYLTEISWLHDKRYFSTGRFDVVLLVALSLVLTIFFFISQEVAGARWIQDTIGFSRYRQLQAHVIFVGLVAAALMAFVKDIGIKIIGLGLAVASLLVSSQLVVLLVTFVPTLIHVFVFTSIFMLYGALKSNSTPGFIAVGLHLALAAVLLFLLPGVPAVEATSYGQQAYLEGFAGVNTAIFNFDYFQERSYANLIERLGTSRDELTIVQLIFQSDEGIGIMRFIAFAYTYHYLNWFSKTEVIRWHQVPRGRFAAVVIAAVASVVLYAIDYSLGLRWLFLLSFMHVMLEFPLNWVSTTGVVRELFQRSKLETG